MNANSQTENIFTRKKRHREKPHSPNTFDDRSVKLNNEELEVLKQMWESKNFGDLHNWCQGLQCKIKIEQEEIIHGQKFKTVITLLDDGNKLNSRTLIKAEAFGKNKKESKTNTMRKIMNLLIEENLIHKGFKDKKFLRMNSEQVNTNTTSINEDEVRFFIHTQDQVNEDYTEKEIQNKTKTIVKEVKANNFTTACNLLMELKKMKPELEWFEISFPWYNALRENNIENIKAIVDILQDEPKSKFNSDYPMTAQPISSNENLSLFQKLASLTNYKDQIHIHLSSKLSFQTLDELFFSLIFSNNWEFSYQVLNLLHNSLSYPQDTFLCTSALDYYKRMKRLYFIEILDTIYLAKSKVLEHNSKCPPVEISGDITIIGNRFAQEVISFSPNTDSSSLETKLIKKSLLVSRESYAMMTEGEIVLLKKDNHNRIGMIKEIANDFTCKLIINEIEGQEKEENRLKGWKMIKLVNYVLFQKSLDALKQFTTQKCCSESIQRIIFSTDDSNMDVMLPLSRKRILYDDIMLDNFEVKNKFLNSSQQEALKLAVSQTLTLIQGPPGTGKTATSVEIILEWLRYDLTNSSSLSSTILVCAESNIAVDILYRELTIAGVNSIRLGLKECQSSDEPSEKVTFGQIRRKILNASVICSTCIGSFSEYLTDMKFSRVIIDEATQATEMSSIVPLIKYCQQLVLIGDHKQLPPTVISIEAQKNGLSVSLFERLIKNGITPIMLNTQYRMHSSISEFPSIHFYGGKIKNGVSDTQRLPILGFTWPNPNINVAFIDVRGKEEPEGFGCSYYNQLEVNTILDIIVNLLQVQSVQLNQIGIITPYDSQKRKIKNELNILMRNNLISLPSQTKIDVISVDTVDGFQGMDKDLILFSAVRSNFKGEVGFLKDPRRLNVMLTRARRGLIVIGDYSSLICDENWKAWLKWVEKNQVMVE